MPGKRVKANIYENIELPADGRGVVGVVSLTFELKWIGFNSILGKQILDFDSVHILENAT